MIHHKYYQRRIEVYYFTKGKRSPPPYGVSRAMRAISPQALLKNFDRIRAFLSTTLCLTTAQRETVFRLLRLWTYYGKAYPKEAQITKEPGCSKATFWRTIDALEAMSMVTRVNRYVKREHAQISNLYLLDKLVLAIAKYLSEHGHHFNQLWLKPLFEMDWREFWASLTPGALAPP